jgi:hypothetical protein
MGEILLQAKKKNDNLKQTFKLSDLWKKKLSVLREKKTNLKV